MKLKLFLALMLVLVLPHMAAAVPTEINVTTVKERVVSVDLGSEYDFEISESWSDLSDEGVALHFTNLTSTTKEDKWIAIAVCSLYGSPWDQFSRNATTELFITTFTIGLLDSIGEDGGEVIDEWTAKSSTSEQVHVDTISTTDLGMIHIATYYSGNESIYVSVLSHLDKNETQKAIETLTIT